MVIVPGGITGDLQVNSAALSHPLKTSYRGKETLLMIEKSEEHPNKVPTPNRNEVTKMCKAAFSKQLQKLI